MIVKLWKFICSLCCLIKYSTVGLSKFILKAPSLLASFAFHAMSRKTSWVGKANAVGMKQNVNTHISRFIVMNPEPHNTE